MLDTYQLGPKSVGRAGGAGGGGLASLGVAEGREAGGMLATIAEQEQRRNIANQQMEQQRKSGNAQLGGTIGGAIGSMWGPVGTGIGSVLGSLVGGAF